MTANTTITMDSARDLQRLHAWLSPAFPVGAFAYSAGLETAISDGTVMNGEALADWLSGNLAHGSGRLDAIFVAQAHRAHADIEQLKTLGAICLALAPARQRHEELLTIGGAFRDAVSAWADTPNAEDNLPDNCPYPIAVGATAGHHRIDPRMTLVAYLTAYVQSQISVAVRLVPLGQTEGLRILSTLEPCVADCAEVALLAKDDAYGSISYATDIAAMAHETQMSRTFRS